MISLIKISLLDFLELFMFIFDIENDFLELNLATFYDDDDGF